MEIFNLLSDRKHVTTTVPRCGRAEQYAGARSLGGSQREPRREHLGMRPRTGERDLPPGFPENNG